MSSQKKLFGSPTKIPPAKRKQQDANNTSATDANMEEAISLALAKQRDQLETVITRTITSAVGSVNDSVKKLQRDLDAHMDVVRGLMSKVERVQADTRTMKRQVLDNTTSLEKFQQKLALLEDHNRRNNVRITGITTGREGNNAITFLQEMLPKWIPSLGNKIIEIERAHRIYGPHAKGNTPQTMILRLLRHGDRNAILNGAREATKHAPIQDAGRSLRFYADYSAHTSQRRKAFAGVQKSLREKGISSFIIYPATLKITLDGEQRSFSTPEDAEEFLRGSQRGVSTTRAAARQQMEMMEQEREMVREESTDT